MTAAPAWLVWGRADVRYIDPHANRSAGAIMQHQLEPYCRGQAFRYERKPGPKPR